MPNAFLHGGIWFGLVATFACGLIITHCITILIKCSHILCHRLEIPSLSYAGTADTAFSNSYIKCFRPFGSSFRLIVDIFICIDLLGSCCVYVIMVATTIKAVVEDHLPDVDLNVRLYILALVIPFLSILMIRSLKHLAPFSTIANILMFCGLISILAYTCHDMPPISDRLAVASFTKFPVFFGITIFALECVAVVMSLENNAKYPQNFITIPGVVCISMSCVTILYAVVGLLGYWKYGDDIKGSITLNLPNGSG